MFAFGKIKPSATGLTKEESASFADNLMAAFNGYSLNDENFNTLKKKYLGKLKKITKIETVLKSDDSEHPVVTVIATTIDQSSADTWATHNQDRVLTRTVMSYLFGNGTDEESLRQDRMFQNFAFRSINKFTDELPISEQKTIDVTCKLVEGDNGKMYWVPEELNELNEFLNPGFMVESAKESDINNFIATLYGSSDVYSPPAPSKVTTPVTTTPPEIKPYESEVTTPYTPTTTYSPNDKWLIYWYVCGTDIESQRSYGDVRRCIEEVEKANLSANVKILMQAGGTTVWKHPKFTANNGKVGRYVYAANDRTWTPRQMFYTNDPIHAANMGSYEGLKDFLEYGKQYEQENGVPEHRVFIFVDHGGGSLSGVCQDELFDGRMIGLSDIRKAFKEVWGTSDNNPPFEVVAFDTCVMSTYETAVCLEGISRYMVASQESIYGSVMFEYTGLLNGLSANPAMNGAELGKIICDTYRNDALNHSNRSANLSPADVMTMSVIDISRMPALKSAYDEFGRTALVYVKNSGYSATSLFSNVAVQSERYPCDEIINSAARAGQYLVADAVDLKNFAENVMIAKGGYAPDNLKQVSNKLVAAVDNAVIYNKVRGSVLARGGGLSTPYPYVVGNFGFYTFDSLAKEGLAPQSQSDLYKKLADTVSTPRRGFNIPFGVNTQGGGVNIASGSVFDLSDLQGHVVDVDKDEQTVSINLTKDEMDRISNVYGLIAYFKVVDDVAHMVFLGNDTNITEDWESGDFTGKFDGKWIKINGQPILVQVYSKAPIVNGQKIGTELYISPIVLNDTTCNLMIACDYPSETYKIIGARPEVNSATPTGEIYGIDKGDVVKPMYLGYSMTKKTVNDDKKAEKQLEEMKKAAKEFEELTKKAENGKEIDQKRYEELAKMMNKAGLEFSVGDPIPIGDSVEIKKDTLPNGYYVYLFQLVNPVGGKDAFSDMEAIFTLEEGKLILRDDYDMEKILKLQGFIESKDPELPELPELGLKVENDK